VNRPFSGVDADVLNEKGRPVKSGHRVSTMEVESALVDHNAVAEAAVIGQNHDIKGQAIAAFVSVKAGVDGSSALMDQLKGHVTTWLSAPRPRSSTVWPPGPTG